MDILIGKRQEGKTTHLIRMSAAGHGTIVTPTEQSAEYIKAQAKMMKLNIPEPISWSRLTKIGEGGYGGGPYLLDELGGILRGLSIKTAILDDGCTIANLSLVAENHAATQDYSQRSDFKARPKIIAVDFDGTLIEEGKWPGVGAANEKVLNYCKQEQAKGARVILWTNRVEEPLANAVKWCEEHGLHLDAVNDNVQEAIDFLGVNTRKIYADEFIDDRMNSGFDLPYVASKPTREYSLEEAFQMWKEKYLDETHDPVFFYKPHKTLPNTIIVEVFSGFEWVFQADETGGHALNFGEYEGYRKEKNKK